MVALELVGLTKEWPAMKIDVDLSVEPGSLVALAGPSGCGKSTILRMIAGLCPPDAGTVSIDGVNVTAQSPREREVGMVFQDYALFPHLDVLSNVAYGLAIRGVSRKARETRALEILETLGMANFARRHPHDLSGGEKQRVALARTIAVRPRVVLFDEPLSSLDAALRKRLRLEIRQYQKQFGLTAVYVTHDLEEALAMADKVAIMDKGTILHCATPMDLWLNPLSMKVAQFLGNGPCLSILRFEAAEDEVRAITESGSFRLRQEALRQWKQHKIETESPATGAGSAGSPETFIFFERTAAKPLGAAQGLSQEAGEGHFSAVCVRNDFAGDVVDCVLKTGKEVISVRLPTDSAPEPGQELHFMVKAEQVQVLSK